MKSEKSMMTLHFQSREHRDRRIR